MQIEVKGRNVSVTDELREHVEKRFARSGKQVSDLARLEVEVCARAQPVQPRGARSSRRRSTSRASTLRARDSSARPQALRQPLRGGARRQVKRHRDKRRKRREARAASPRSGVQPAPEAGLNAAQAASGRC